MPPPQAIAAENSEEETSSIEVAPREAPLDGSTRSFASGDENVEGGCSKDDAEATKGGSGAEWDGGILAPSRRWACIAYLLQYFAVGIVYGGMPGTTYGFFLGYLSVPSYVYATVGVIIMIPWNFKFAFGLLNDTLPIRGQRRRPYMAIGWAFCAAMLLVLACLPLPTPYWCVDEATGYYVKTKTLPDGKTVPAEPCNPAARESGGVYALFMMLAAFGYVVADVAADGLTVEYAREEPIEKRGSIQTTAYMTRTLGQAFTSLFVGFSMNGKLYNGSFDSSLSFSSVTLCLAVPAAVMVPVTWFLIEEPRRKAERTCKEYLRESWQLLTGKAFLYVLLNAFLTTSIQEITTTAGGMVKQNWAKVENLQNQLFSLAGNLFFAGGLWAVKKWFLNRSWRCMIAVTIIVLNVLDSVFTTCTIFDVVRSQYFYLGETVLREVPLAASFVVSSFVVVEMADSGNEGLVYGLLTTAGNLGSPLAQAFANQIFSFFRPSLSKEANYIKDTPEFRWTVFWSFVLSYGFSLASLSCLYFLPPQKQEAQRRKTAWPHRTAFGVIAVALVFAALCYSIASNVLSMIPSTMCMRLAGGDGCDE